MKVLVEWTKTVSSLQYLFIYYLTFLIGYFLNICIQVIAQFLRSDFLSHDHHASLFCKRHVGTSGKCKSICLLSKGSVCRPWLRSVFMIQASFWQPTCMLFRSCQKQCSIVCVHYCQCDQSHTHFPVCELCKQTCVHSCCESQFCQREEKL